jgi:hypothetical protein
VKAAGALAQKIAGHELVVGGLRRHVAGVDYHSLNMVLMHSWWTCRCVAHRGHSVHHVHRHGLLSAKMAILLRVHFNRRVGETAGDSLKFLFAVVIDGVIEDAVLRFEGTYADKAGAVNLF